MNAIDHLIPHLLEVQKPAQYLGGEVNAVKKIPEGRLRVALAFPDLYEVGMSYTGLQILYSLLNREDGFFAERVFAPWPDMEKLLRGTCTPLFTLETKTPLASMDVLGFTFQYELCYTNVLQMLDLAGIPLRASERTSGPIVMAGGPCVYNPEPAAAFVDVFYMGEAERELVDVLNSVKALKDAGRSRSDILTQLHVRYPFLYVPSMHGVTTSGPFQVVTPSRPVKRTFPDTFSESDFPSKLIVPNVSVIYDRVSLEISRGCDEGCRFCQAGMIYRPSRERSPEDLMAQARQLLDTTGWDEISLSSLSTADYPGIEDLVSLMVNEFEDKRIATALPSIRADRFRESFAEEIKRVRKTGFTIAPEAGSQRLRNIINKNLTEESILSAARLAYKHGWKHIKLYFMIGLPGETREDLDEMVAVTQRIAAMNPRGYAVLSVSTFVPKSHTPFQWAPQLTLAEVQERQAYIRSRIRARNVRTRFHDPGQSMVEGLLARGDRRTGEMILQAYLDGARFDGWTDYFDYERWKAAAEKVELSSEHLYQELGPDIRVPWDFVDIAVAPDFFRREWERSRQGETTAMCESPASCNACRACAPEQITSRFQEKQAVSDQLRRMREQRRLLEAAHSNSTDDVEPGRYFYQFSYAKKGLTRFISHLDLVTIFSRAMRIAGLPVTFTRGFNPRPVLKFSPALELGIAGENEAVVGEFVRSFGVSQAQEALNQALPEGIHVTDIAEIPMTERNFVTRDADFVYEVTFPTPPRLNPDWLHGEMEKKSKKKGLRVVRLSDYVKRVDISGSTATVVIRHTGQGGSLRISEVLPQIFPGADIKNAIMTRKQLIYLQGDA